MKLPIKTFFFILALVCGYSCQKEDTQGTVVPITPDAGTTVYGYVSTIDGNPVPFAVVSDGVTSVRTGNDGIYQIRSAKKNGLVFICPPPYYTVNRINYATGGTGSQPQFWQLLTEDDPEKPERHDFTLIHEPDQDNHTRLVFGDIHIYSDASAKCFSELFIPKVNAQIRAGVHKTPTGLTLGDMSWDQFWYTNNYRNTKYLTLANTINLPVFNTVGNHDHDMKYYPEDAKWINSLQEIVDTGEDWSVMIPYRKLQGPTCYSWNIGKVHYISMDDAMTIDDGTGIMTEDHRDCRMGFAEDDIKWLKSDLQFINPTKPIVLSIHMPFTNRSGSYRKAYNFPVSTRYDGMSTEDMLKPFSGYNLKLVLSAHIHDPYNHQCTIGDLSFPEYNCGSVCGHFWNPTINGLAICSDGSPTGYRVLEWNGTEIKSNMYQVLEKKGFYPFRSYDRNNIELTADVIRTESTKSGFYTRSSDNYVYISIWDWKDGWSISVTENGKPLSVQTLEAGVYDPIALLMRSSGKMGSVSEPGFRLKRVKASSPSSTLVITVQDEYGHKATETMVRPKTFDINTYYKEDYSK